MFSEPRVLGRTGLRVGRLGLASSYGAGAAEVEAAFERGVNYLYWGSLRRSGFGCGVANVCRRARERAVVVVQSYSRIACLLGPSLRIALARLGLDYADVLLLGYWNGGLNGGGRGVWPWILDAAVALRERGLCRAVAVSTHTRTLAPALARDERIGAVHVRYNAAHRGAEREIFPHLPPDPAASAGIVCFTATRWGTLLERPDAGVPDGDPTPTAADCYRFVLSHPRADVVIAGPRDGAELRHALTALDRGPMDEAELSWMRRFGDAVYGAGGRGRLMTAAAERF